MTDQNRSFKTKFIDHRDDVTGKLRHRVAVLRTARGTKSAPSDANDMEPIAELWCERIVDVGRVPHAAQEHQRPTLPTPIDHFEPHCLLDRDELDRSLRLSGHRNGNTDEEGTREQPTHSSSGGSGQTESRSN
jgi:hypothetical protein